MFGFVCALYLWMSLLHLLSEWLSRTKIHLSLGHHSRNTNGGSALCAYHTRSASNAEKYICCFARFINISFGAKEWEPQRLKNQILRSFAAVWAPGSSLLCPYEMNSNGFQIGSGKMHDVLLWHRLLRSRIFFQRSRWCTIVSSDGEKIEVYQYLVLCEGQMCVGTGATLQEREYSIIKVVGRRGRSVRDVPICGSILCA